MYAVMLIRKDFMDRNCVDREFKLQLAQLLKLKQRREIIIQRSDCNDVDELKDYDLYKVKLLQDENAVLVKPTDVITLDSDWEDTDNLEDLIAFLIYKYHNNIELIPKVTKSTKNVIENAVIFQPVVIHTMIYDICEALGKIYSYTDDIKTFKTHIANLFKVYPKKYHELIVRVLIENLESNESIRERYIRAITGLIKDVNAQITTLEQICHSAFANTDNKRLCTKLLLNKIKRNIGKARKDSIMKMMRLSKYFADPKKVTRIIYKQITERFKEDCDLMHKFANICKYRVNELFDHICRYDKNGKHIVLMIEKFPLLDRKRAIDIISNRKDVNQELVRVLDKIRETYMMS